MQDHDIEKVLKAAGPRERPPVEIERAMRENLRQEWRSVVAERHGRQRRVALALAAGVMATAIGAWLVVPNFTAPAQAVGTVALTTGGLHAKSGRFGSWERAVPGAPVMTGQTLATEPTGRGAITLAGGISARLDQATRIGVAAADRLVIERGAVYVDAGADAAAAAPLEIVTAAGSVRHVGTQYEVRVLEGGVRVRVREGTVEWRTGSGPATSGRAGEQLTISDSRIERGRVEPHDQAWDWVAAAAPGIDVEGMSLTGFLDWAARELGRRVEFTTPEVAREAAAVVLHGSVAGLSPPEALQAVLATTRMQASLTDGLIVVAARQ
ncbi:MAG TPA: FecR family protein [Steroidobacteraceae bacterium]|jgi:ferric-dicitrate binding protein FerR (iron transport regulator)